MATKPKKLRQTASFNKFDSNEIKHLKESSFHISDACDNTQVFDFKYILLFGLVGS